MKLMSKIPITRSMLCYIVYITAIVLNDYITYFKLFSAPLWGYALAALLALGLAFLLRKYFEIEKDAVCWADIMVIAACLALYAYRLPIANHWSDGDHCHVFFQEYPFENNISYNYMPATDIQSFAYPLGDRLSTLFRRFLGYRLGTVTNPLVIILFYFQTKRIIASLLAGHKLRAPVLALCAGVGFASLHAFFLINCYNSDLWLIPLVLEIVYLLLIGKSGPAVTIYLCWLSGIMAALRISNGLFVAVLAALYIALNYKTIRLREVLLGAASLVFPIAVYAINAYVQTGSPTFPFANNIFKSEYFAPIAWSDDRWGPENTWQGLIWPVYGMIDRTRIGEFRTPELSLGFGYILAIVWLARAAYRRFIRRERPERRHWLIPAIIVIMHLANSFLMVGYWRYIIFLAPLSGALAAQTAVEIVHRIKVLPASGKRIYKRIGLAAVCLPFLLNLCFVGGTVLLTNRNWAAIEPIFEDNMPSVYKDNAAYILRDIDSGVDESFYGDIKALAMGGGTTVYPALIGMDETPLISIIPSYSEQAQSEMLRLNGGSGFYLMTSGAAVQGILGGLNNSGYKLGGEIRRTKANFLNSEDWLYALELRPLKSGEPAAVDILTAHFRSGNASFEWTAPGASGKSTFEAFLGHCIDMPQWDGAAESVILDVHLNAGGASELIASYTVPPGELPSKIEFELDIPQGEYTIGFAVRPINGALSDYPWSVMLIQPELTALSN